MRPISCSRSIVPLKMPSALRTCSRIRRSSATSTNPMPKMASAAEPALCGWLIIDKPAGLTSSRVVERLRRSVGVKAGHAGTLDPLATGVLPVALGEATKTIRFASAGRKRYQFVIRWGAATDTDDREGKVLAEAPARPARSEVEAALPRFCG